MARYAQRKDIESICGKELHDVTSWQQSVAQNDRHLGQSSTGSRFRFVTDLMAAIIPRWFIVTQANTMQAISVHIVYAPAVTSIEVVIAIWLVHGLVARQHPQPLFR